MCREFRQDVPDPPLGIFKKFVLKNQAQKKTREEIQHKEFWGPQDPPPLKILYVSLFPVF